MGLRGQQETKQRFGRFTQYVCAVLLVWTLILPSGSLVFAKAPAVRDVPEPVSTAIAPAQLDALVAPVALYPDNLLAQVLVASTYPLELIELHQWLQKNPELAKDQKKLNEAVAKQPWDPSIQSMASLPDVVKWLAEDVQWTSDLGNAFLAQQKDVMDAVQRMRAVAKDKGTLVSNDKMKVDTQVVESKQVIVIEPSNPDVVYVPSYNPVYVYGEIGYPYPPIYYPPYYYGSGAYWAAGAIGFGMGLVLGAAWGGWGWACHWGGGDININRNNNFTRNSNIGNGNLGNRNQVNPLGDRGGKWSHDASHRRGAPYRDRATADRFGGSTRGDSIANRQSSARNQLGRHGGDLASTRSKTGNGFASRGNAPGFSNRASGIGNGSKGLGSGNRSGGFKGGSSGNRGSSSMGGSRGGSFGGSRGGGFGGGMRGGGGRRR